MGFGGVSTDPGKAWGSRFRCRSYFKKRIRMRVRNANVAFPVSVDESDSLLFLLFSLFCSLYVLQKSLTMAQTFQQEYMQMPPMTRTYSTACVLTTLAVVRFVYTERRDLFGYDINSESAASFTASVFQLGAPVAQSGQPDSSVGAPR